MVMKHESRRTWKLGFALVSLLSVGACADVDGLENGELVEDQSDLAQVSGTDATAPEERVDLGVGNGSDVIMMGDSWMSLLFDGIQPAFTSAGKKYRGYGAPGVKLSYPGGLGPLIPTQWDRAVRENPNIKTVIMTGGGNDVLLGGSERDDCPRGGPKCKVLLTNIIKTLNQLWEKMAAAGVKDVVYIGYSEGAGGGSATPEITNTTTNGTGAACLAMKSLRCTPLDTTSIVKRRLKPDGIHPVQAANVDIAVAVYKIMEEKGMRR